MRKEHWLMLALALGLLLPLLAAPLAGAGGIGSNFVILNEPEIEMSPSVAYNPDRQEYLVVWYNDRPANDDIRARRVSEKGTVQGDAFYISAGAGYERRYPDVAYNSQQRQYLVVWEHYDPGFGDYSIRARRISETGQVLDPADIVLASGYGVATLSNPAVAYASAEDKYLVVWHETWHPSPLNHDIVGKIVSGSGTPDPGNILISDDPGNGDYRRAPDVAYNLRRNEFLVAWEQRDHVFGDYNIYARRVQGNGTPMQPESIDIGLLSGDQLNPAVASIPTEAHQGHYLVVWEDHWVPSSVDIWARRVKGEGTTDDANFPLTESSLDQRNPAVAGKESSRQYLVVWTQRPAAGEISIQGQNVSMDGRPVGRDWPCDGPYSDHAAVASGDLDFMIVYDDTAGISNRGIYGQRWGNQVYLPHIVRNR